MSNDYQPKGRMVTMLAAMKADPERIWTTAECAKVMGCSANKVGTTLLYSLHHRVIYRDRPGRGVRYSLTPFPVEVPPPPKQDRKGRGRGHPEKAPRPPALWTPEPGDIRIPRVVPGWVPPKMVCPRAVANS